MLKNQKKKVWSAVWVSDVHLGTRDCKATELLSFLKAHPCKKLYLVGDIIDGWRFSTNKWYWPSAHNQVVRQILRKAEKHGTEVFYVTGNHDEFLREYVAEHQLEMGNIKVVNEVMHVTTNDQILWVVHGDAYDSVGVHSKWLTFISDYGYDFLLWVTRLINKVRHQLKLPYWSLSAALKNNVKGASDYIARFEEALAKETKKRKATGVVCGHIHHAEIKEINGIQYHNCGDWVDSCTALIEADTGELFIRYWGEQNVQELESFRQLKAEVLRLTDEEIAILDELVPGKMPALATEAVHD